MTSFRLRFPQTQALMPFLTSALKGNGVDGDLAILSRKPNWYAGLFPSEIVPCRWADGTKFTFLCKYESNPYQDKWGSWGSVAYKAQVYRHVLEPLRLSTPQLHGARTEKTTGETLLLIEYLNHSELLSKSADPDAMPAAARWIAQFHTANETRLPRASMSFLAPFDEKHYLGWARRTSLYARQTSQRTSWLQTLCESFEELVGHFLNLLQSVIHGEFYGTNILLQRGVIRAVDWETAAIAVGELDVAVLIEGGPREIARQCELEYQRALAGRATHQFRADPCGRAALVQFRWLGDRPEWTNDPKFAWRFEKLRIAGEQLRLI